MDYSIDNFWKMKFSGVERCTGLSTYNGWIGVTPPDDSYVEAKLSLREGYTDVGQPIWLVAAPGAVGKSTLAKEICARTGAIYLDLATAATVGGNCITGGLVHTGALDAWRSGKAALVIDALDEARLRVTQPAFEDFLKDIVEVARLGSYPIILLGRVGIIEETWTTFNELEDIELPIFNIDLFDIDQAKVFVARRLTRLASLRHSNNELEYPHLEKLQNQHQAVYSEIVNSVVDGLQGLAGNESKSFVGYAPVLDAVAKVIASETNPSRLGDELQNILEGEVLVRLGDEILRRESKKLEDQLRISIHQLPDELYSPEEQLKRLACRLFKLTPPILPENIPAQHATAYMGAVESLLPQHPFLDGAGSAPSNAVFAAYIVVAALRSDDSTLRARGENYSTYMQHTPNPFLYDFYPRANGDIVPIAHVGLLYESVLAKSKMGDIVSLAIDEGDDKVLEVEIIKGRADEENLDVETFNADSSGILAFGRRVSNISVDASDLFVSLGTGDTLELNAPIAINCSFLEVNCKNIIAKGEPETAVVLESEEVSASAVTTSPVVRGGVQLMVSWPGSNIFPWTSYSATETNQEEESLGNIIRVFRRLVMAFRSHSKGRLARYKNKIEHSRMLKGSQGKALLAKLQADKIVSLEKHMYYLDANALGAKTGASFLDVNLKRYSNKTTEYLKAII
ncbi:hypothetical protein VV867_11795 [Pseudomonas sp. JH-2]|uniref:hypothetical protein n=1 Tax=Pseudomonas sp. JH-2 TaxID=3114998 RepID=UPI002E26F5D3|nr:hypothetical protein [Pseudomonas sp. JH-2]